MRKKRLTLKQRYTSRPRPHFSFSSSHFSHRSGPYRPQVERESLQRTTTPKTGGQCPEIETRAAEYKHKSPFGDSLSALRLIASTDEELRTLKPIRHCSSHCPPCSHVERNQIPPAGSRKTCLLGPRRMTAADAHRSPRHVRPRLIISQRPKPRPASHVRTRLRRERSTPRHRRGRLFRTELSTRREPNLRLALGAKTKRSPRKTPSSHVRTTFVTELKPQSSP